MTKKHVKAGRKGGIMGTGKAKRRGSADYYRELGIKSGEARRRKLVSVCWASHEPEIATGAWINGPSGDVIVDGAGEHYDNCFNSPSAIDTTVNKE